MMKMLKKHKVTEIYPNRKIDTILKYLKIDDAKSSAFSPWPSKNGTGASQIMVNTEDEDEETDNDNEDVDIDDENKSVGRQSPESQKSSRPDDTANCRAKPSIFSVSSLLSNDRGRGNDKQEDKEEEEEITLPSQLQPHHLGKPPLFYTGMDENMKSRKKNRKFYFVTYFKGLTLDFLAQRQRLQGQTPQLLHGQDSPLSPNFGIFQRNPATGLPSFPLGGLFQNVPAGLPSLAVMKAAGSPLVR